MENYLVRLDYNLSSTAYWNIITLIKPLTTKLEVISVFIPILLITIDDSNLDLVQNMFGVVTVEKEGIFELF